MHGVLVSRRPKGRVPVCGDLTLVSGRELRKIAITQKVRTLIPITKPASSVRTPETSDELQAARARFTSAEASLESAEEKSRAARKKRKEAKKIARAAKKSLRLAKEEFAEAKRDLAEARRSVARKKAAATRAKSRARKARRTARRMARKTAPAEPQPATSALTDGPSDATLPELGSV
jgi:chromosome segregation ATPase